ncbi:hypothetical protein [Flavobacterium sp. PL02]|uniref:hypothetical protein n=1 Tax=Flavobacterium sp. PL02 TaxID=3088354 RepID=UPI002B225FE5|nr:hypothetical protein [Flavobacterium sp. PL02]MEA9414187.1 hypothetical protein [Flavobacterium sp. PL02]
MAIIKSKITLGTTTNLIFGYNPSWNPSSLDNQGLFVQDKKALKELEIDINPDKKLEWKYPIVSIHEDAENLLNALFPYQIDNPNDGAPDAEVAAGTMLLRDQDRDEALKKLSENLGLDLKASDTSYALVKLERLSATAFHPINKSGTILHPNPLLPSTEYQIEEDFRKSLIKVRASDDEKGQYNPAETTLNQANICMKHFNEWGTHFVSGVNVGDIIFQVFAYNKDSFKKVSASFSKNKYTDEDSVNFCYFTTNALTGAFGFVKEYSKLISFGNSKLLESDIKKNLWHDQRWSETNSIFEPFLDGKINLANYKENAVTRFKLTTLSVFAEYNRRLVMKRILKGALIQKFTDRVVPNFEKYFPYDIKNVIPDSEIPGFLSTIVTKDINTYKAKLALDEMQFIASNKALKFILCSQYLYSKIGTISIPGNYINILTQSTNMETDKGVVVCKLSKDGYKSFNLNSKVFYGGMVVTKDDFTEHFTIVDGLKFMHDTAKIHGRSLVLITDDVRKEPKESDVFPDMEENLSFAYSFAESIMAGCTDFNDTNQKNALNFVADTMGWITSILPQVSSNANVLDLRVRAMDSVRNAMNPEYAAYVPLLPAKEYKKHIETIIQYSDGIALEIQKYQDIIEVRKTKELIIDVGKSLNENIIESGKLLTKFIQANADQQRDLSSYYKEIITQKEKELKSLEAKIATFQKNVDSQKSDLQTAVLNYKQAVRDWQTRQAIQFGLDMATTIFSVATSIAIPAKSIKAVEELGLKVQQMQKLLNILNASYKVFTTGVKGVEELLNAEKALNELKNASFAIESNLAWDEMSANMKLIIDSGPPVQEKNDLINAFQILLLRGKALLSAKDAANQLAKDIYNQQRLNVLSEAQQKRLDGIKDQLKPGNIPSLEPLNLDLIGMTASLQFLRNRMLSMLSKTLILQDQALQYENLQAPTLMTAFDLLSFKGTIVKQSQNTLTALNLLNSIHQSVTSPIRITVEVPVGKLINGNAYILDIGLDNVNFSEYINCRVKSVVASVGTSVKTKSGKYLLKLTYEGNPFFDRAPNRIPRMFKTPSRERIYEYKCDTNTPNFTDGGDTWSKEVSPITPFCKWNISFPKTEINKGIELEDAFVPVTLEFVLEARIEDLPGRLLSGVKKGLLGNALTSAPSLQDMLVLMQGKTVTNGWDVVFNMGLTKIQETINKQYDELKKDKSYGGKIKLEYHYDATSKVKTWVKFEAEYGYPKLSFLPNNPSNVKMECIIHSGKITKGSQYKSEPIEWDEPEVSNPGALIQAQIPLSEAKGIVGSGTIASENVLSVILDMSQGTFVPKNINIEGNDEKARFNLELISYFTQNPVVFVVSSLDKSKIGKISDMKPNQFLFKTLITRNSANQILQLFIMTNDRIAESSQTFLNNLPEPIPMGSDVSMIVSSKVLFESVLPQSLDKSGWQLEGTNPKDTNKSKAWSGKFNQGALTAEVNLSALDSSYTSPRGVVEISKYAVDGGIISEPISGMTLTPNGTNIKLDFNQQRTQHFTEYWKTIIWFRTESGTKDHSSDYTLNISASMPLTISGTGREQNISFKMTNQDVKISGHLSGGGPCGCGNDLQALFNIQLNEQIPPKLTKQLNVSFNDVSVFALKNLIFPQGNYIELKDVNCPGDLLITGSII